MDVDSSDDKVMPHAGNTEGNNSSGVVVPRGEGADYIKVKEREGLAQLPVAPVNGPAEGTAEGDALMEEVEDVKATIHDDEEEEDGDANDDLFGDEGEDEEDEEKKLAERQDSAAAGASGEDRDDDDLSEAELERRRRLEYEEEDAPVLEEKVEYAQMRLPKIPIASQTQKLYHAKLPNFLHLESAAFDPSTYNSEEEPKNLPVENIIRWRWRPQDASNPSAPPSKQTNARVIRWNDGSMSLQLGSEIFDIATDRTATGKSVAPTPAPGASSNQGGADSSTYLVAQHGYVGLLETQALVTGNLTFRPTTIQSTSHRKIASSFAAQQQRKGKTVMIQAADDPEAAKLALERKAKAAKKPRAPKGEGSGGAARKGGRRSVRSTNLADWSDNDVLTDEEIDAAGDKSRALDRRSRRDREKAEMEDFLASESDEDGEGAEEDDEDDDDGTGKSRKGRKQKDGEMDITDDLDEMEAQAEQVARAERSKKKKTKGSSGAAAAPQDIDSDDLDNSENEGFVRKKLVIESDEE